MTDYLPAQDIQNLRKTVGAGKGTHYEATAETIRQLKAAHVEILAGTDAPNPGTGEIAGEKRASASGPPPLIVGDGTISSFEDGTDHSAFGAGWSKSTDSLMGGKSTTAFEIVADSANGTKKALRITGDIASGGPYNWAGAMFSSSAHPFAPANLSKTPRLRFWAKGDGKTVAIIDRKIAAPDRGSVEIAVAALDQASERVSPIAGIERN